MQRCIDLAAGGMGTTAPNPLVGSVIVHEGTIIGEGFHRIFGGPHAEVNAVRAVQKKELLPRSTLYVNLEPCAHTGKTPPCADMIISAGIRRVVVGTADPNPLVAGKGLQKLKHAGVEVITGVLADACKWLNRRFFTYHEKNRPYVVLKWARSADGYIDIQRNSASPRQPTWISNDISRMLVHKWRSEEQSILVGTRTAGLDNPRLNVREWSGGHSPLRMVIDRALSLPKSLHLFDNSVPTIVFNAQHESVDKLTNYIKLDFDKNILPQIFGFLRTLQIQSILVEGGRQLIQSFIDSNCWDESREFTGRVMFGDGVHAPIIGHLEPAAYTIRQDILRSCHNPGAANIPEDQGNRSI